MQVSWLIFLAGIATGVATDAESSKVPLGDLQQIREAIPAGGECTELRKLEHELEVFSGNAQQAVATIHGSEGCWTDLLTIWQQVDGSFHVWRSFDEGKAHAKLFQHGGKKFLYLTQSQPAGGRSWVGYMLYWVTDNGELQVVEFDGKNPCGATLPHLGDDFHHGYGGFYSFDDDGLRFKWNIWEPGDSPNFPSGGSARGTLSLQEPSIPQSNLRLAVDNCLVTPPS